MASKDLPAREPDDTEVMLGLLSAVERNDAVTQRSLAAELGIALGLVNAYLKRCVKKGLIKVQQVPPRRYAYYLTPKGFAEKSQLTASYLSYSFAFFRRARSACAASFAEAAARGWRRVALAGAGDLAEVAAICAHDSPITLVAMVDPDLGRETFAGLPVVAAPGDATFDGLIVTDLGAPQSAYDRAVAALGEGRVLVPEILAEALERTPATRAGETVS